MKPLHVAAIDRWRYDTLTEARKFAADMRDSGYREVKIKRFPNHEPS